MRRRNRLQRFTHLMKISIQRITGRYIRACIRHQPQIQNWFITVRHMTVMKRISGKWVSMRAVSHWQREFLLRRQFCGHISGSAEQLTGSLREWAWHVFAGHGTSLQNCVCWLYRRRLSERQQALESCGWFCGFCYSGRMHRHSLRWLPLAVWRHGRRFFVW